MIQVYEQMIINREGDIINQTFSSLIESLKDFEAEIDKLCQRLGVN